MNYPFAHELIVKPMIDCKNQIKPIPNNTGHYENIRTCGKKAPILHIPFRKRALNMMNRLVEVEQPIKVKTIKAKRMSQQGQHLPVIVLVVDV